MDLDAAIRRRRMCRSFQDKPVPPELVDRLVDLARRAPSAGRSQGWAFVVLEGHEQTSRFWSTDADPDWLAQPDHPGVLRAPVLVIPWYSRQAYLERYGRPDKAAAGLDVEAEWPAPYWLVDTAFATMLLLLGAVDAGLGALLFRLHSEPERIRTVLGIPDGWEPVGVVALGWPAPGEEVRGRPRRPLRPLDEVLHRGGW